MVICALFLTQPMIIQNKSNSRFIFFHRKTQEGVGDGRKGEGKLMERGEGGEEGGDYQIQQNSCFKTCESQFDSARNNFGRPKFGRIIAADFCLGSENVFNVQKRNLGSLLLLRPPKVPISSFLTDIQANNTI
jgi:hypothetical protein